MYRWTKTWWAALIVLMAVGPKRPAGAATVEAMTLEQMARRADVIFIGKARRSRTEWNVERTRIYTYVTLEVERVLKGGAGEREMTIRLLGGRVGAFTSMVPGTPRFLDGEEVLLFCAGSRARIPTVLGLSLGKFTLQRDGSGQRILKRDISGLLLKSYRTDSRPAGVAPTRFRLSEVEARIQAALGN